MRVLVVDNRSKHTKKICSLLGDLTVVDFTQLDQVDVSGFDAIILSGGGFIPVMGNDESFGRELEMIRSTSVPLLGICLGFELICHAFNEDLVFRDNKRHGEFIIQTVQDNPLFSCSFSAYEAHRWYVPEVTGLDVLAVSSSGVEGVKHPIRSVYGVQFHPEVSNLEVIKNFLRLARTFS